MRSFYRINDCANWNLHDLGRACASRHFFSHPVPAVLCLNDRLVKEIDQIINMPVGPEDHVASTPAVETALLIHRRALGDFRAYVDFLGAANHLVQRLGLRGVIQIASFHPQYRFAGTKPDAVENYTNRSPFPMLHLLREESVSEVNRSPEAMADIPGRNVETLKALGRARIVAMLAAVKQATE